MKEILKGYTNEQLNQIKDAVYKISDAYHTLNDLSNDMISKKQWYGQADIEHIAYLIDDRLTGKEGCIHEFLKAL